MNDGKNTWTNEHNTEELTHPVPPASPAPHTHIPSHPRPHPHPRIFVSAVCGYARTCTMTLASGGLANAPTRRRAR